MSEPNYYAETDDPGTYEKRWLLIEGWSKEAKAKGCNVTRTEIKGDKLTFSGWHHPSAAPQPEGIRFEPLEASWVFDDAWQAKDGRISTASVDVDFGRPDERYEPPENTVKAGFEIERAKATDMVDLEPYPALSPNRMYGDCLRFIYKDGRYVLQQRWIIPQEGLRVPQFEWRDVETVERDQAMTAKEASQLTGRSVTWLRTHECMWCGQSCLYALTHGCGAIYEKCTQEQSVARAKKP